MNSRTKNILIGVLLVGIISMTMLAAIGQNIVLILVRLQKMVMYVVILLMVPV